MFDYPFQLDSHGRRAFPSGLLAFYVQIRHTQNGFSNLLLPELINGLVMMAYHRVLILCYADA